MKGLAGLQRGGQAGGYIRTDLLKTRRYSRETFIIALQAPTET